MSPNKDRHIKYREFINNPPHIVDGKPEWSDPRVSAHDTPLTIPFTQEEPGIAIQINGNRLLIDGYCRSVLFVRDSKDTDQFLVWMPDQAV